MRQWRIGTFSMGLLLILLGVTLLVANFGNEKVVKMLLVWWPVILVVIGLEVLIYLFSSKEKMPFLKFDVLSIVFIGLIGFAGISFYMASSLGIVDEVKAAVSEEVHTGALPMTEHKVPDHIEKVVVFSDFARPEILAHKNDNLVIFGSYKTTMSDDAFESKDVAQIVEAGNTLYVQFFPGDYQSGLVNQRNQIQPKLSLPETVDVEWAHDLENVPVSK
ncbi:hypothetical protein SAMN05421676_107110 [Salinibacillus kushneri]|uniref:DUF5668 domain-containing protein n=1 Tax=Salinibacillus kushneri TaxID=237682 RepID=A0A1I0GS75_9BACI|nr:hypothetical protein [Salinibacillus kushneri]SET73184.1 hypothetical protein SAMN05421676_107110 [Salinibacillus kushneri]